MKHCMVDIETMGNKSNSAIASVAAVEFDLETGEVGRKFYEKVDLQSSVNIGMKLDCSTIEWWLQQNEAARAEMVRPGKNIGEVLFLFRKFLQDLGTIELMVWGNSARFDLGILNDAYNNIRQDIPWLFRNEMDVRTLVALYPEIKKSVTFVGTAHNPIDDCLHQIKYCSLTYKALKGVKV